MLVLCDPVINVNVVCAAGVTRVTQLSEFPSVDIAGLTRTRWMQKNVLRRTSTKMLQIYLRDNYSGK